MGNYPPNPDDTPGEIKASLSRYVERRIPTGDFLRAVLVNDLKDAIGRADHMNIHLLPEIVSFCYNNLPPSCWGSEEKVAKWLGGRDGAKVSIQEKGGTD